MGTSKSTVRKYFAKLMCVVIFLSIDVQERNVSFLFSRNESFLCFPMCQCIIVVTSKSLEYITKVQSKKTYFLNRICTWVKRRCHSLKMKCRFLLIVSFAVCQKEQNDNIVLFLD